MLLPEINSTSKSSPVPRPPQPNQTRTALSRTGTHACTTPNIGCCVHSCQTSPCGNPSSFSSTSSLFLLLISSTSSLFSTSSGSQTFLQNGVSQSWKCDHVISKILRPATQSYTSGNKEKEVFGGEATNF